MLFAWIPYVSFFTSTLMLGTFMAVSSNSPIFVWMGLEVNLMSLIPLLLISNSFFEALGTMKYFLIQSTASLILLLSILFKLHLNNIATPLMTAAFLIKLGMPPCHFWLPSLMMMLNWLSCMILASWQKIAPLFLLFYLSLFSSWVIILMLLALFISSMGGLNQTQVRALLAYSSIGHMSWMIISSSNSILTSTLYFCIYLLTTILIMSTFWKMNFYTFFLSKKLLITPLSGLFLTMIILSLAGLPPFLGFVAKWFVIENISLMAPFLIFSLILSSMINLSYYLNLCFSSMFYNSLMFSYLTPKTILSTTLSLSLIMGAPILLWYAMILFY